MPTRLAFFGSSDFGLAALERLRQDDSIELVAIVTQSAKPKGRGGQVESTAVARWGQNHDVPVLEVRTLRLPESLAAIKSLRADVFLVASFGLILPATVLDLPSKGALNIHASLLPRFRGASPIAAAILSGDSETGVTFMLMDVGMDTGPILAQHRLPIDDSETTPTLSSRLSTLAAEHILDFMGGWLAGTLTPQPQSSVGATLAPKISKQDGHATWESAKQLERKIRAYQPWPGVTCHWADRQFKIISARWLSGQADGPSGFVVPHSAPPGWRITCQDGWLVPETVQFATKRPQPAASVPGSYPNFIGSRLN